MKPYKNLSSKNLTLLLLITRITTVLASISILFSSVGIMNQSFRLIAIHPSHWASIGIPPISSALTVLFCSGVMAAIIAFEESYRKKSEAYIASLN